MDWEQNQAVIQWSEELKKPCFLSVCTTYMQSTPFSAPSTSMAIRCPLPNSSSFFWGTLMATSIKADSKLLVSVYDV